MDVTPLIGSGATATSQSANALNGLADDFDQFLTLLTTQMQYQDPLSPMDSTEFTNQLVLFSQVEQQISTNDQLETLNTSFGASAAQASLSFIGLDASYLGSTFNHAGGQATLAYDLPEEAASASIDIVDANGNTIRTLPGTTNNGYNSVVWNGLDASGNPAPAGIYEMTVAAQTSDERTLTATRMVEGRVTGIESQAGQLMLMMGNLAIPVDQVLSATVPEESQNGSSP